MFELVAGSLALGVVAQVVFWTFVGLLFPVFWLWMFLDAAFRQESAYANGGKEKLVWLLALLVFQFVALVYFLAVYRTGSTDAARVPAAA